MLPIAGKTAGPNGLNFLGTLMGGRMVPRATPGSLASMDI